MGVVIITTQKKLERISFNVSNILGDQVSGDYRIDGDIYTGQMRETSINKAILDKYNAKLAQLIKPGMENESFREFLKLNPRYQEFRQIIVILGNPNTKAIPKGDDIKKVVGMRVLNGLQGTRGDVVPVVNGTIGELTADKYDKALGNPDSNFHPSETNPWFFEQKETIRLEIGNDRNGHTSTLISGVIDLTVLTQPIYQIFDLTGPDVNISWTWVDEISQMAAQILLQQQQF